MRFQGFLKGLRFRVWGSGFSRGVVLVVALWTLTFGVSVCTTTDRLNVSVLGGAFEVSQGSIGGTIDEGPF